jgi:hypothetical protein
MIDNFDLVKKQLQELATVINEFKSEAVQLRVIEILFEKMGLESENTEEKSVKVKTLKKKKNQGVKTNATNKEKKTRSKRVSKGGRPGPGTTINGLIDNDYFKKPKAVQDIIDHCKSQKGYTYNTSELSVGLIRATRNNLLKRTKNDQNQWEYCQ